MVALTTTLGVGALGCAPPEGEELDVRQQEGLSLNGLSLNGLSLNGLSLNGLSLNGLSLNGLSLNGLSLNGLSLNGAFPEWFNTADGGNIAMHDMAMKYVIRCALSEGRTASFTDVNGVVHTWQGGLGLADTWDTNPPTEDQKSWVSACMMAHANNALPAPKTIQLSVRGAAPSLDVGSFEQGAFTTADGVFFGDLFGSTQKRYLCKPDKAAPSNYLTTLLTDWGRQCSYSPDGCGGMFTMVDCASTCQQASSSPNYKYGPSCTVDGVSYKAISAFVPNYKKARDFSRVGVQLSSCANCLDGYAMTYFTATSYAQVGTWTTNATGGNVYFDVRYMNNTTATQNIRVQVNGVTQMNGTSANWDLPPTGGVWKTRAITAVLAPGATVKLMGPTSGAGPSMVDVVSLRIR